MITDPSHPTGSLHVAEAAAVADGAVGQSDANEDYVRSTLTHLQALGIRDHWLEDVAKRIGV